MSYWVKLFSDGTQEKGTDTNIAKGKASWSKGRLSHMIAAILHFGGQTIRLEGRGPYWQKDIATMSFNLPPRRIARQLGKKINEDDIGWATLLGGNFGSFTIRIVKEEPTLIRTRVHVQESDIGHFLVVTISNTGEVKLSVEKKFHV